MNEKVNKFLLVGDKFMPERHLRQPRFTYSSCEIFTKTKERIQEFKETGDLYELDKDCFEHEMAYGNFKYLTIRKVLRDKTFNIAKDSKYDGY